MQVKADTLKAILERDAFGRFYTEYVIDVLKEARLFPRFSQRSHSCTSLQSPNVLRGTLSKRSVLLCRYLPKPYPNVGGESGGTNEFQMRALQRGARHVCQ